MDFCHQRCPVPKRVAKRTHGGNPIIRGPRISVEHISGLLAAGDGPEPILKKYHCLEIENIQASQVTARRMVGHERVEPLLVGRGAIKTLLNICVCKRVWI